LKNVCVKNSLFQAIKDVPIYAKFVQELYLKKAGRRRKDLPIVQVIGQLVDLMLGKVFTTKYKYFGSPTIDVYINNICIPNTLIDLGVVINVMTRETMEKLKLTNLQQTPIFLQMDNQSIIKPEGILEDVVIFVDSWEYLVEFMVLKPKFNLGGYSLILGRPWLATTDAYIDCSYFPWKLYQKFHPIPSYQTNIIWVGDGDNDDEYIQRFLMVD
jgi:hypothetical protein